MSSILEIVIAIKEPFGQAFKDAGKTIKPLQKTGELLSKVGIGQFPENNAVFGDVGQNKENEE